MLYLLADENFRAKIVQGVLRIQAADILRIQDTHLISADDFAVLAWAAQQGRILLTHDIKTIPPIANQRIALGQLMPGVIIVPWLMPIGLAIAELSVYLGAGRVEDFENRVVYIHL